MSSEWLRAGWRSTLADPRDKPEDDGGVPEDDGCVALFAVEAQKLIGISLEGSVG